MTQQELDRQLARHTGEDIREIRRRGFSLIDPFDSDFDPQPDYPPQVIDWDEVDRWRRM
ncbi:MAG: hypothetical protein R3C03_22165 [Pirellulaceae bacterium]